MRDITQLHPDLQDKLVELITLCLRNGIEIKITECLRTVAEQDALYAKGRTEPGSIVTKAKGSSYSSQHQWGIAADFCLAMDIDGDGSIADDSFNNCKQTFNKVGKLAKSIGLGWGGDWKSIVDLPHLYLPQWGSTTSELRTKYGTPDKFMQTWKREPQPGTYKTTAAAYLRSKPGTVDSKAKLCDIKSATVRGKCNDDGKGYAKFKAGETFTATEFVTIGTDLWAKTKSGYWLPVKYNSKVRAEKV